MTLEYQHEWTKPTTLYTLLTRDCGGQYDAPTGELRCDDCGMTALHIEHIPHLPWCRSREQPGVRLPPQVWLARGGRPECVPAPPSRAGHDPRFESVLHAARSRALYPLDHPSADGGGFVDGLLDAAGRYHGWRDCHDYNDLDWRIDELYPDELNVGRRAENTG